MILNKLKLTGFRNYSRTEFTFSDKINLIVGQNSVGKTNILEAIYLLASGKCFRIKETEKEAIKYGEEIGRVMGEVESGGGYEGVEGKATLEVVLTTGEVGGEKTGKKKFLVNGVAKRGFDFLGNFRAVYFGPEDLELVTDSPGVRRKYLDMVLSQVSHEYGRAHLSYEKGIRSRNKILEEMRESGITDRRRLFFWDQLLIKNGNVITKEREKYIDYLNSKKVEGFGGYGEFEVEYDHSVISEARLKQYEQEEAAAGMTLVGPHRDNFVVKLKVKSEKLKVAEERDLSVYGSRGEQRLAILWLKMGESAYIREKTNDLPVLLLDDIFSELDVPHRQLVFALTKNQQTIVTTADLGMVEKEWLKDVKIINL